MLTWRKKARCTCAQSLSSRDFNLPFYAQFEVSYIPLVSARRQSNPDAAAVLMVTRAAANVCARHPVTALSVAQQECSALLGRPQTASSGEVRVLHAKVALAVAPEHLQHAREHEQQMAAQVRAEEIQNREIWRADIFRRHVLGDPGRALGYWAMNHPERIDRASRDSIIELVQSVSEKSGDIEPWRRVASILSDFVGSLSWVEKRMLLDLLSNAIETLGNGGNGASELRALSAALQPPSSSASSHAGRGVAARPTGDGLLAREDD